MKTLTEFDGFRLKTALEKKKELVAAGKTAEELPAALGEALKLEGDKLTLMLNALELAEGKGQNLKRIVVFTIAEGKTAPSGAIQKNDKFYLAEFFYTAPQGKPARGRDGERGGGRGGRGDRKKGGRGGRGDRKDRPGGRRDERRDAGIRVAPKQPGAPVVIVTAPESGEQGRRPPRGGRPRRPEGAGLKAAVAGPPQVKPNVQPNKAPASGDPASSPTGGSTGEPSTQS